MDICIRLAVPDDIPAMAGLLGLLFAQEGEFGADPERQNRGLSMILAAPDAGGLFVAEAASEVVGMVSVLFTVSTALGGRAALLEDMVVAPGWRAAGVGARLLDAALDHCRAAGVKRVTLLTDEDNSVAGRFYEKLGFTASGMRPYRKRLPD